MKHPLLFTSRAKCIGLENKWGVFLLEMENSLSWLRFGGFCIVRALELVLKGATCQQHLRKHKPRISGVSESLNKNIIWIEKKEKKVDFLQNGRIQLLQRLHCSVRAPGKNSNSFFRNLFRFLPAFSIQYYINIDMWLFRFSFSSEKYLDLTILLCASLLHAGDPLCICPESRKSIGMAWTYICNLWSGIR